VGTPLWFPKSSAGGPAHKQVRTYPSCRRGVREPDLSQDTDRARAWLLSPRLPSDWLNLDKSMFQLVAQTVGARREPEPKESLQEPHCAALSSKPPW
jgi:hypothetical protein